MRNRFDRDLRDRRRWVTRPDRGGRLIAGLSGILFATFLSPQFGLLGRGLKLSIPLFVLLLGVAVLLNGREVTRQLGRRVKPLLLGTMFAGTGALRFLVAPDPSLLQNQVLAGVVCIIVWLAVVVVRQVFPESCETARWLALVTLGVSLGMGLPLLLREPGIARLTMGNPMAERYAANLFPRGVANYSWYTPVACAWPVIADWLHNGRQQPLVKVVGWSLLSAASAATLLSTFTMAAVWLTLGTLLWLFLVAMTGSSALWRLIAIGALVFLLVSCGTLRRELSRFSGTALVADKFTRLIERTFAVGVVEGDETGRARMLVRTIETFLNHPLFGAWGIDSSFYVGGHSSWADTLALHGLFGTSLWLGFLAPSWRRRNAPLSSRRGTAGGTLSWALLAVGGVVNPTLNSPIALLLIWLFDQGAAWTTEPQGARKS